MRDFLVTTIKLDDFRDRYKPGNLLKEENDSIVKYSYVDTFMFNERRLIIDKQKNQREYQAYRLEVSAYQQTITVYEREVSQNDIVTLQTLIMKDVIKQQSDRKNSYFFKLPRELVAKILQYDINQDPECEQHVSTKL